MHTIIDKLLKQTHVSSWIFPAENIELSVEEIKKRVLTYAQYFQKKGVKRGDRIGFILENSHDLVCLLYAAWSINAIAVPLRTRSNRHHSYQNHIENCHKVCDFTYLICEEEAIFSEIKDFCSAQVISLDLINTIKENLLQTTFDHHFFPACIDKEDIAIIQFSSGSTGNPKGVVVTHSMMMAQLQNIQDNHQRSRGRKVTTSASWLPINHDMGLFIGVLSPIFSDCKNILAPPSYYMKNPAHWFALLAEHRVDFTFTTNSVLASTSNMLKRLRKSAHNDLSELHIYIAAEKVSPVIVRKTFDILSKFNVKENHLHIGYGMAENTLGASYTTGGPIKTNWFILEEDNHLSVRHSENPHAFELVSIGIPNDCHNITIRNQQNQILPDLVLGEICIESPCVSPAYYKNPQLTQEKLGNRCLRTGDLGFRYQGEFYFYSRKDDLIITGGRNIVPDDVEATVEQLAFIRPGASVLLATDDNHRGIMQLYLLLEGDSRLGHEQILERCIQIRKIIHDKHDLLVKQILFCDKGTIEKTSSGKKRRKVILQRFLSQDISFLPIESNHGKNKKAVGM